MNYLFDRKIQLAILALLCVAVVVSFRSGAANMLQNLIAEVAGIAVGVWLTVTLVEKMLERRRLDKWQEVRSQIFRALSTHIGDIVTDYMRYLDSGFQYLPTVIAGQLELSVEAAEAMGAALEQMRKDRHAGGVQNLFEATEWNFSRLRDVLTPRLIDFGEEPKLIQLLVDIDGERLMWKNYPIAEESDWEDFDLAFDTAMDTLETLVKLYRYLATN